MFLEISQNSQEDICVRDSFFNTVACNFIKKEYLVQLYSCEFCEISKNTFFTEHLRTTASKQNFKLFGPFLWIGFNCLKATEPPRVLTSLLWTCFDPLSHQKFLALNWSTSERWKVGRPWSHPDFFFHIGANYFAKWVK